ncbi:MAG: F0F1 ATP synthase subunit A [Dehalococcoidia bacterium]|nr:F0F1 ATP synthase subunit A [Dehalococcoidia bacterium]
MGGLLSTTKGKLLLVLAVLGLVAAGFIFLKGPIPHIDPAAEWVFQAGSLRFTNSIMASWVTVVVLAVFAILVTRRMRLVPRGVQNLLETFIETMLNFVEGVAGKKWGRRFFPVVMTIFLFVLVSNWMGLLPGFGTIGVVRDAQVQFGKEKAEEVHATSFTTVNVAGLDVALMLPGGEAAEKPKEASEHGAPASGEAAHAKPILVPFFRSANTDLNTPLALALVALVFIEMWGFQSLGPMYLSKFFNVRRLLRGEIFNGIIDLAIGLLEIVSELARVISFTFRLFGNVFAGEVLLIVITFLVPLVFVLVFYGLELFVGFMQAFVFAFLTLIFGVMAVASHGEDHKGHHEGGEAAEAHH